jgi:hypothetical protein
MAAKYCDLIYKSILTDLITKLRSGNTPMYCRGIISVAR